MPGINFQDTPEYNDKVNAAENISEFINDPEIMKIREELLKGEQPKGCADCFKLENDGIRSFRQTSNEIYEEHIDKSLKNVSEDGFLDPQAITYLDISLG
jgi:protein-arginine kinase activator protein McsA